MIQLTYDSPCLSLSLMLPPSILIDESAPFPKLLNKALILIAKVLFSVCEVPIFINVLEINGNSP